MNMIRQLFSSRISIIVLILIILQFYHFNYLPDILLYYPDSWLLYLLFLMFVLSILGDGWRQGEKLNNIINKSLIGVLILSLINAVVCYKFRDQGVRTTLSHWVPIYILFLYYPFIKLDLSIRGWEKILYYLFVLMVIINIVMNLFPMSDLFRMTSGIDKFEVDLRVRVFGDGIMSLGNIFCLNKVLVGEQKTKYTFMFLLSLLLIFLTGFRMIAIACFFVVLFLLVKHNRFTIRYIFSFFIISSVLIVISLRIPVVQERIDEMKERSETDNFDSEDYVRVLLVTYYYTEYFKNNIELIFGSGMVQRLITRGSYNNGVKNSDYESEYSKDVSYMSDEYHFHPVDMGLIGLSWEAGIPTVLILIFLLVYLIKTKTDPRYYYISAWAFFILLISWNNPKLYHHHNIIYFTVILVIFTKVINLEKKNKALISTNKKVVS